MRPQADPGSTPGASETATHLHHRRSEKTEVKQRPHLSRNVSKVGTTPHFFCVCLFSGTQFWKHVGHFFCFCLLPFLGFIFIELFLLKGCLAGICENVSSDIPAVFPLNFRSIYVLTFPVSLFIWFIKNNNYLKNRCCYMTHWSLTTSFLHRNFLRRHKHSKEPFQWQRNECCSMAGRCFMAVSMFKHAT